MECTTVITIDNIAAFAIGFVFMAAFLRVLGLLK